MTVKNQAVPDEVLNKGFLSQFRTEADVTYHDTCYQQHDIALQ